MKTFTKENLIDELKKISQLGWVKSKRRKNHGSVGNTLEDLLGIKENNLPIPNASEWELKTQREKSNSLTTLIHIEPSPRAIKFVPMVFLKHYGWKHKKAGKKYSKTERSFRQTIHGLSSSDRGFLIVLDKLNRKVLISFNHTKVSERHSNWLKEVEEKIGLNELNPQPYWGFDDLSNKLGTKLLNCFYVQALVKKDKRSEYYNFYKIMMLQKFKFTNFLSEIEKGNIFVDFDARTGHNHGTKFRMRQNCLPDLYEERNIIL